MHTGKSHAILVHYGCTHVSHIVERLTTGLEQVCRKPHHDASVPADDRESARARATKIASCAITKAASQYLCVCRRAWWSVGCAVLDGSARNAAGRTL